MVAPWPKFEREDEGEGEAVMASRRSPGVGHVRFVWMAHVRRLVVACRL